jgi:hypothetical protein
MPDDEPNKNQMIFIINVCNQSRPVVGYVEHQTDANQIYVAPRLFNVCEVLPIGRLGYFVPRLQGCLPLGVLTDGILNPLLSKDPHRHIFTDCKVLAKALFTECKVFRRGSPNRCLCIKRIFCGLTPLARYSST